LLGRSLAPRSGRARRAGAAAGTGGRPLEARPFGGGSGCSVEARVRGRACGRRPGSGPARREGCREALEARRYESDPASSRRPLLRRQDSRELLSALLNAHAALLGQYLFQPRTAVTRLCSRNSFAPLPPACRQRRKCLPGAHFVPRTGFRPRALRRPARWPSARARRRASRRDAAEATMNSNRAPVKARMRKYRMRES